MSRPLVGFLLFCVVLGGIAGLALWWVGPTIVSLALGEGQRNEPYYLLHFAAVNPVDRDVYAGNYQVPLTQLVIDDGGRFEWQADTLQLVEGSVRDEWTEVVLVRFSRASDFVRMITSHDYRQISASNPAERVVVGVREAPFAFAGNSAVVLYLFQLDNAVAGPFATVKPGLVNLDRYGGEVVWEAEVSVIEGQAENWDRLIAMQFKTLDQAKSWLSDPTSVTERTISRRNMKQVVMLLLRGTVPTNSQRIDGAPHTDQPGLKP